MKIGSLFSGYGGLDIAVEHHFNAETVWHAEFEDAPSKVLAAHWPGVPNHRDVSVIDWTAVEPVDIITGGFPCQDVSMAGKRAGMVEGTRSNLWGAMRTAIETIRPQYAVIENVRGLLSAKAQSDSDLEQRPGFMGDEPNVTLRAIGRVLGDLVDIGFNAEWYGLRAADIGAPHSRYRVFILATDTRSPTIGEHAGGSSEEEARAGSRDRLSDSHGEQPARNWRQALTDTTSARSQGSERGLPKRNPRSRPELGGRRHQTAANAIDNGRWRLERCTVPQGRPDTQDTGKSDTSRTRIPERANTSTAWGAYETAIRRWERALGRAAPAPTELSAKGKPQLSPVFVEWMMGLNEGHVTGIDGISRSDQLKMLGNGVVPQQALAALRVMTERMRHAEAI